MKCSAPVFTLFIAIILSLVSAAKRKLSKSNLGSPHHVVKKVRNFSRPDMEALFIPTEIFVHIFANYFDRIDTGRTMVDPLKNFKMVSTQWNERLRSAEFGELMRAHPRMALLMLKRFYRVGKDENVDLLLACKDLLDTESARKILLNARSPKVFQHLGELAIFEHVGLQGKAYNNILNEAIDTGALTVPQLPEDYETRMYLKDVRTIIQEYFDENAPVFMLPEMNISQLLLLIFLEDMYVPERLTPVYEFVAVQIMMAYRTGRGKLVKPIIRHLNAIQLPRKKNHLLFTLLEYQIFIAAFIGDQPFLRFLSIDYAAAKRMDRGSARFIDAIAAVARGEEKQYPTGALLEAEPLLECRMYEERFRMDVEAIITRAEAIRDDPDASDDIKDFVLEYLYEPFA